jgi:2-C-methyl-D-erythritol 4-phosphate cytidylyltransferase/2-C-methyl-D-erythritol 2,4-cyclodiphosphate synthase
MKVIALVPSAGSGNRMASGKDDKPFLELRGKPLLFYALSCLNVSGSIDEVILIVKKKYLDQARRLVDEYGFSKVTDVIPGGETRTESVSKGLARADAEEGDIVLIHDGARPFLNDAAIRDIVGSAEQYGAAVLGVSCKSTIKKVNKEGIIEKTVDRTNLWEAQTPQAFKYGVIKKAYDKFSGESATDDSCFAEYIGEKVHMVEGNAENIKVTTQSDMDMADAILGKEKSTSNMKIGMGYDIHRLVENRPLFLGGVNIPYEKGLEGHSDADVLLHSICDAILGAMGSGDIGMRYPDTDPKYKDISSRELLKDVKDLMENKGFSVGNLDCTIIAEEPKMGPYRESIVDQISNILDIPKELVNIKAKTFEKMGSIGKGEAIASYATVLLTQV